MIVNITVPFMIEISPMGLALVPVVIGIVQVLKIYVSEYFAPLLSLVVGIGASFLLPIETVQNTLITGVTIGLMASGAYSGARHLLK